MKDPTFKKIVQAIACAPLMTSSTLLAVVITAAVAVVLAVLSTPPLKTRLDTSGNDADQYLL